MISASKNIARPHSRMAMRREFSSSGFAASGRQNFFKETSIAAVSEVSLQVEISGGNHAFRSLSLEWWLSYHCNAAFTNGGLAVQIYGCRRGSSH